MVAQVDVTGISYFLPVIAFLLVAFIMFAVFTKLKLFENKWAITVVALFIAIIFITLAGSVDYIKYIGAWIAILFVTLVFILAIVGMFGKGLEGWTAGIGKVFVIIAILVFLISGFVVYNSYFTPFLPGGSSVGSGSTGGQFFNWLYSSKVTGAIILLVISVIAAWFLTRGK